MKFSPMAVCFTLTWPGPGEPTSTSSRRIFSGPPFSCIKIDFAIFKRSPFGHCLGLALLRRAFGLRVLVLLDLALDRRLRLRRVGTAIAGSRVVAQLAQRIGAALEVRMHEARHQFVGAHGRR